MLPTYMLVLSVTYCLALVFTFYRAGSDKRHIALDLALAIMIGGFLGARLLHVAYEYPTFYWDNPGEIFKFWRGGFVYYGGFIGALVLCSIYVHFKKISFLAWADFYAPVLSLGYALGRVGCFFNGCCFGDVCTLPWAVEFNYPGLPTGLRHPTQLYAMIFELCVFAFLLGFERRSKKGPSRSQGPAASYTAHTGDLFFTWLGLHGCGRLVMEAFWDDDRGAFILGLSISTWLSLILIVVAIIGLLKVATLRGMSPPKY